MSLATLNAISTHIARICLNGEQGESTASELCEHIVHAIHDNRIQASEYPDLLNILADRYPLVFLDVFSGSNGTEHLMLREIFFRNFFEHKNPIAQIPEDKILVWCEVEPEKRYSWLASSMLTFVESKEDNPAIWKPLIYSMLDRAPNLSAFLDALADSIRPMSWSDPLADILQRRSVLFPALFQHDNPEIVEWARSQHVKLEEEIRAHREREQRGNRERYESFE